MLHLTPAEARVVASLIEKSVTTPQYYPMTVNAITAAASQKNARDPVMKLTEGEVGAALLSLERLELVTRDESSSRAVKWRHRFHHQLLIKPPTMAVLAALMLRGPQTVAELRAHAQPMGGPDDAAQLTAILADLEDRAQPLVRLLPRAPGQKEARYAHLLSGEPALPPADTRAAPRRDEQTLVASLRARIAELEARIAELEARES